MEVKLASKRGFCFGVEDAIELAQNTIESNPTGEVIALGPVIHNKQVVHQLQNEGLDQSGDLEEIPSGHTLLIRWTRRAKAAERVARKSEPGWRAEGFCPWLSGAEPDAQRALSRVPRRPHHLF